MKVAGLACTALRFRGRSGRSSPRGKRSKLVRLVGRNALLLSCAGHRLPCSNGHLPRLACDAFKLDQPGPNHKYRLVQIQTVCLGRQGDLTTCVRSGHITGPGASFAARIAADRVPSTLVRCSCPDFCCQPNIGTPVANQPSDGQQILSNMLSVSQPFRDCGSV